MKSKSSISEDVVKKSALLSRLKLSEKEIHLFSEQLSLILDYIEKLKQVDTKDVEPTSHVLKDMSNVFRSDKSRPSISVEKALQNAPLKKDAFFVVPKVVNDR